MELERIKFTDIGDGFAVSTVRIGADYETVVIRSDGETIKEVHTDNPDAANNAHANMVAELAIIEVRL